MIGIKALNYSSEAYTQNVLKEPCIRKSDDFKNKLVSALESKIKQDNFPEEEQETGEEKTEIKITDTDLEKSDGKKSAGKVKSYNAYKKRKLHSDINYVNTIKSRIKNSSYYENTLKNVNSISENKFLEKLINDDITGIQDQKINLYSYRNSSENNIINKSLNSKEKLLNNETAVRSRVTELLKSAGISEEDIEKFIEKADTSEENAIKQLLTGIIQEKQFLETDLKPVFKNIENIISENIEKVKETAIEKTVPYEDINIEVYRQDTTYFKGDSFADFSGKNERKSNPYVPEIKQIKKLNMEEEEPEIKQAAFNSSLNYFA